MTMIPCRLLNGSRSLFRKAAAAVAANSRPASTTSTSSTSTTTLPKIEYSSFFEGAAEDRKMYVKHFEDYMVPQTTLEGTNDPRIGLFFDHFRKALLYNIPHGKMARTLPLAVSYKYLNKNPERVTQEQIFQCNILAWCFETVHSYILLTDDLVDGSPTRRKKTCWYLMDMIGMSAVNDAFSMHSGVYKVLHRYCRDKPYYVQAMELVNEHCWEVNIGQTLDILLQVDHPSKQAKLKELHTMTNYLACVEYKTSATFWHSLAMALFMNGITDATVHYEVKEMIRTLGHLFQYQNDGVDLYGDTTKTKRVGTDIEDGKCTIFSVKALEIGNSRQVKILEENLGRKDPEGAKLVKEVYNELGFPAMYGELTRNTYNSIFERLENSKSVVPEEWFRYCIRLFFEDSHLAQPK